MTCTLYIPYVSPAHQDTPKHLLRMRKSRAKAKDDAPVSRKNTRAGIEHVLPAAGGPDDTT